MELGKHCELGIINSVEKTKLKLKHCGSTIGLCAHSRWQPHLETTVHETEVSEWTLLTSCFKPNPDTSFPPKSSVGGWGTMGEDGRLGGYALRTPPNP